MYNLCTENVHLDKCSLLEADQQPDMLFTPWMLDWLLWSVTVHMKCSWGINLDPARWNEVGHLQQDLSGIFRSCHHTTGLSLKARKGVPHSLSTKQGQWSIFQLQTLSSLKVQLLCSKRTFQWVSHQTVFSYLSGQRIKSGQRSKNWC